MHFNDTVSLDSQKSGIIGHYNQTQSGVDTVDQMIGALWCGQEHQKMACGYILHNFEYYWNKCSDCSYAEHVKIRCRIFIRNLIMQLMFFAEQIKRCSEISTGVHKPLHLKLHQFQTQIEGNSNDNRDTTPSTNRKSVCYVLCTQNKLLIKIFWQVLWKVCVPWAQRYCLRWLSQTFAEPAIEDSH